MTDLSNLSRTELQCSRVDAAGKLARIEADIEAIKSDMASRLSGVNAEAQKVRSHLGQVEAEIARREAQDAMVPTISDHALLRFIERVHGVDVEAMKAELLTENMVTAIKSGATGVKTGHGTFVIKGSTVVTFLGAEMRAKRKTRKGMRDLPDDQEEDAA